MGRDLFQLPGKNVLVEALEGGGVRGVYALCRSVTHAPWPEALPSEDFLEERYVVSLEIALMSRLG